LTPCVGSAETSPLMTKCPLCGSPDAVSTELLYEGTDGLLYELRTVRPGPNLITLNEAATLARVSRTDITAALRASRAKVIVIFDESYAHIDAVDRCRHDKGGPL